MNKFPQGCLPAFYKVRGGEEVVFLLSDIILGKTVEIELLGHRSILLELKTPLTALRAFKRILKAIT